MSASIIRAIFRSKSLSGFIFFLVLVSVSVQAENYQSTASIAAMVNQFSDHEKTKEQLCNDLLLYVGWIETAYRTSYDLASIKIDLTVCDKMDLDKIRVLTHEVYYRPQEQLKPAVVFMNGYNRLIVYEDTSGVMRRYESIGDPELADFEFLSTWILVDDADPSKIRIGFVDPYSGASAEIYKETALYEPVDNIGSANILSADITLEDISINVPDDVIAVYGDTSEHKYQFEHHLKGYSNQKNININIKDETTLQKLVRYFTPGQDRTTLENRIRKNLKGSWGKVPLSVFLPTMPRSRLNTFDHRELNCFNAAKNFFNDDVDDKSNALEILKVFLSFNYCKVGAYNERMVLTYGDILYVPGLHAARFLFKDKKGRSWIFEKVSFEPATPWRVNTLDEVYKSYKVFLRSDTVMDVYRRCDPGQFRNE